MQLVYTHHPVDCGAGVLLVEVVPSLALAGEQYLVGFISAALNP